MPYSWEIEAAEIAAQRDKWAIYAEADRLEAEAQAEREAGNTITATYLGAVQGELLRRAEEAR